ncbi:MAG: cytochrome c [Anaerolineae bacterium]|nr:cytochrome c [Anaerolineae bacterium]
MSTKTAAATRWPVYVVLAMLLIVAAIFVVLFVQSSEPVTTNQPAEVLTSETYLDKVEPLLADAHPENGDALVVTYDCAACHRAGVANHIAPSFEGVAERAAERRPPLTAAAYIYESIIYPYAYEVQGFGGVMPHDYATRLSEDELGDIIAYLLSPDAK